MKATNIAFLMLVKTFHYKTMATNIASDMLSDNTRF